MKVKKRERGTLVEKLAEEFLLAQGYSLVARNWRVRQGELDLVMRDKDTLVFVEVRSRTNLDCGHPAETVNRAKQRRLARLAEIWLALNAPMTPSCRFDVVTVITAPNANPMIEHFPDAFSVAR